MMVIVESLKLKIKRMESLNKGKNNEQSNAIKKD